MSLKGLETWCRHFTGVQNDKCEAGIEYVSVRDDSGPGMYRWPCLSNSGATTSCPLFAHYTQAEMDAHERQLIDALNAVDKLETRESDICPHCGKQITSMRQVGRCVYASCGCRLWQGHIPAAWRNEAADETARP